MCLRKDVFNHGQLYFALWTFTALKNIIFVNYIDQILNTLSFEWRFNKNILMKENK